ncbi:MAG: hypothetical protein NZM25_10610 [Leptospiraceae bacterium]|nr:hypothetical protein [Leptospiraceae bacterium]MDW8305879.1 hypothetical protein [Leptospiraceae bacterium]
MSRRLKLFFLISTLIFVLLASIYISLYWGIALFFKRQLPPYLEVRHIELKALDSQIWLRDLFVKNPKRCPQEAVARIQDVIIQVIPDKVQMENIQLRGGDIYGEILNRCGIPDLGEGIPHADKLVPWHGLPVFLRGIYVYLPHVESPILLEQASLLLRRQQGLYRIAIENARARDPWQGSHEVSGQGEFTFAGPKKDFLAKVTSQSKYTTLTWMPKELRKALGELEGQLQLQLVWYIKGEYFGLEGDIRFSPENKNEFARDLLLSLLTNDEGEVVLSIRLRHEYKEGFALFMAKLRQEFERKAQQKISEKLEIVKSLPKFLFSR